MFSFRPSFIPNNIFVVGCGGTGSRLVPTLIQFIRSITKEHNPAGWLGNTNIILIDGDIVEQKNLMRQNFVASDVDKNKAAVLANRYGKAYGMNVIPYTKFIEEDDTASDFRSKLNQSCGLDLRRGEGTDLVIMCVDSVKARKLVMTALAPLSEGMRTTFIDAGNEDSFGQVRMFHNVLLSEWNGRTDEELRKAFKNPERIEHVEMLDYIPFDFKFYDEMVDNPGLGSCADLDQTLAINSLMATFIFSFVQNLYYNKEIDYNEVSLDIVKGSISYTKNTVANYRNKILVTDEQQKGAGYGNSTVNGLKGTCSSLDGSTLLKTAIARNEAALKKLLKEQLEPAPVLEAAAKPTKKRKQIIAVEPIELDLSYITQGATDVQIERNNPHPETTIRGLSGLAQAEARIRAEAVPAVDPLEVEELYARTHDDLEPL